MSQYKLFANCIPVKGAKRSTICDLQMQKAYIIPNDLCDLLQEKKGIFDIESLKQEVEKDSHTILQEYLEFLLERKLVHACDDPEKFPPLDLSWDHPSQITNAILDLDHSTTYSIQEVLMQLEELGCRQVQFRFFTPYSLKKLDTALDAFQASRLSSFEIYMPFEPAIEIQEYHDLCVQHPRIIQLTLHGAPKNKIVAAMEEYRFQVAQVTHKITDASCCGYINSSYFKVSLSLFSESQTYNTCLNRKISVDAQGEIRNCPATPTSFGNIANTRLYTAMMDQRFKSLWGISKDQVKVCSDCEFRYICTDCRAFLKDPDDLYSKPLHCTYDPYSAAWN